MGSVTVRRIGGRHSYGRDGGGGMRTSMLVHVSLLRALNSFMSTLCAASAIVPSLAIPEEPVL